MPEKRFIQADLLITNASARGKLVVADGIVLVEKYGETRFHELDETLSVIGSAQKIILGMILE